ncbi:leucine-rich repeat protein [Ruminococcaceae bacterium OttesenSCG-928-D13]|nr:leucine-rich repeat protein [Ruminococcaceae bacterium OttesenSCG-928-D13]
MKKMLSMLLCLCVLVSNCTVAAFATNVSTPNAYLPEQNEEVYADDLESDPADSGMGDLVDEDTLAADEAGDEPYDESEQDGEDILIVASESEADIAAEGDITRAEWIHELVVLFGMTVKDDNMPDNYFTDINISHTYYRDIMVATEFGVVDIEAGYPFLPDAPVTRDFAAHTLNFCLGFELDENTVYSFSDVQSVAYPDDAQVAVDRSWFVLSSGNFLPEEKITQAEMDAMLADAAVVWVSTDIDEDYDNTYEYASGVVEIPEGTVVSVDENGVVTIKNSPVSISTGQAFAAYFDGILNAYVAKSVSTNGEVTTIVTAEADLEDVVIAMDAQGSTEVDLTLAEPIDEGVITYIEGGTIENNFEDGIVHTQVEGSKNVKAITVSPKILLGNGKTFNVTVTLSNLVVDYKFKGKKEAYFAVTGVATVTGNATFDFWEAGGNPRTLDLITVSVAGGIGKIKVSMEYSVTGTVAVTYSCDFTAGVQYTSDSGFRMVKRFEKKDFTISTQFKLSAGVIASIKANLLAIKGDVYARAGVTLRMDTDTYSEGTPKTCVHLTGFLYASAGASITIFGKTYGDSIQIYTERNSPVRVINHYEDKRSVESCTRDASKYSGNGYHTPSNSRYNNLSGGDSVDGNGVVQPVYTYTVSSNRATITGYTGSVSALVIPSELDGYPVVAIGSSVFYNRKELVVVVIPDSVTTIDYWAFRDCSNLSSVTLPKYLTTLGSLAFGNCDKLTTIEIPKSLTSTSGPFEDCDNLGTIVFETGVTQVVGQLFFKCPGLETIVIPDTVKSIGSSAFLGCVNLENVTIPNSVTTIKSSAFSGCTALEGITIPNSVTTIEGTAFNGCTALESIIIPDSVTTIDYWAFRDCSNLSSVTLSKYLTTLGSLAFGNCDKLTTIEIPKSLTSTSGPFEDCDNLGTIVFETGVTQVVGQLFFKCPGLETIVIPDTVKSIGSSAFLGCVNLENVTIPNSVTTIKSSAFSGCTALEGITIPNSVTTIEGTAFNGCTALESIIIPDSVTTIDYWAFEDCSSLKSAKLPKDLITIASRLFKGCASLETVVLSENLETIGSEAFSGCKNLKDMEFPVTLKAIHSDAFRDNDTITNLIIPKNVTSISSNAFYDSDLLESISLPDKLSSLGSYAFYHCDALTDIEFGYGLKTIPDSAFRLCSSLRSVTLPESLTTIAANAFAECTGLTEIYIPESVTSIQTTSFSYPAFMTIKGVEGSYAQEYANTRNITFVATTPNPIPISDDADLETLKLSVGTLTPSFKADITEYTATVSKDTARVTVTAAASSLKASVSGAGQISLVTGKNVIEITVTAEDGKTTKKYVITVTRLSEDDILLESISLNKTAATLDLNETVQLTAHPNPSGAVLGAVEWLSYNEGIATVSIDGLVKGVSTGTTTIEAKASLLDGTPVTAKCEITVVVNAREISIAPRQVILFVSETQALIASITPPEAAQVLKWQSEDESVVTVASTGEMSAEITAVAPGSTTVYATTESGNVTGYCTVTVQERQGSITLNRSRLVLTNGAAGTFIATLNVPNAPLSYILRDAVTYEVLDWTTKLLIDGTAPAVGNERTIRITPKANSDGQYILRVAGAGNSLGNAWSECRIDIFTTPQTGDPVYPDYRIDPAVVTVSTKQAVNETATQFGLWPDMNASHQISLMTAGVKIQFNGGDTNPNNGVFALIPSDENTVDVQLKTVSGLARKYQDSLEIVLPNGDTIDIDEQLTINVNDKSPALKAAAVTVNTFFDDRTADLSITGGEIMRLQVAGSNTLSWANLTTGATPTDIKIKVDDIPSKASGTLKLEAQLKGWTGWYPVSVKVYRVYTPPALKLANTKVSIYMSTTNAMDNVLTLQPKSSGDTLAGLGVRDVQVDPENSAKASAFGVKDHSFNIRTGAFALYTDRTKSESILKGKLPLLVYVEGASKYAVKLNASISLVKAGTPIKLKAAKKTLTLNPNLVVGESYDIALSTNIDGFDLASYHSQHPMQVLVYDSKDKAKVKTDINAALPENAGNKALAATLSDDGTILTVRIGKDDIFGKTYKVMLTLPDVNAKSPISPTLTLTVKTAKAGVKAGASISVKGKVDISTGVKATVTAKLTNCNGGIIGVPTFEVTPPASVGSTFEVSEGQMDRDFLIKRLSDNSWTVELNPAHGLIPGNYKIALKHGDINGTDSVVTKAVTLKVVASKPKVALSTKKVALYSNDPGSRGIVAITLPAGYAEIADVTLKGAKLANGAVNPDFAYFIRKLDSNTYAIMLDQSKEPEVLAQVKKSTSVTLEIRLKGNDSIKPITTAKVTVAVI